MTLASARRRVSRRAAIRLLALVAVVALLPSTLAAHTGLRSSSPAAGDTVAATLGWVRLEFTHPVSVAMTSLALTAADGRPIVQARAEEVPGSGGRAFVFRLSRLLPPGPCIVAWHTAGADGHVVRGTFRITVASSLPLPAAGVVTPIRHLRPSAEAAAAQVDTDAGAGDVEDDEAPWADPGSPLSVAVRWAGLMALLGMIGAAAFDLLVLRRVRGGAGLERVADRAAYGAWHLAAAGAALSALTLLARLWLQSVALNGPAYAFEGDALDALITGTVWGAGWALQAMATVAFFVGLMVSRAPHGRSVGWMGAGVAAVLLAAVPALSGHASAVEGWTAAAIVSDWLHVLGAGVWMGTLAALLLAGLPAAAFAPEGDRVTAFASLVGAFSPVALAGAGLAGATGVVSALFHFGAVGDLWGTAYGRMLLVKLALLAVVAGLGFYNWRYILPHLHAPGAPARLRRNAGMELAAGVAVILATAILIALPPP